MSKLKLVRAVLLLAFLSASWLSPGVHAEAARPATRRLPDWLDALLRQCEAAKIQYEAITLTVPENTDPKSDHAKVEVLSTEKFWRLASLVELRSGTANMRNLSAPEGPRRTAADFEVLLEVPIIREADLDKLKTASEDLAKLADHVLADPDVTAAQLLASRPSAITIFGRPVHRLPVRLTLTGPRAAVLPRLAQMAAPLPYAYLRGLRATPGATLTVAVSLNLLVKPTPIPTGAPPAPELQRTATEKLAVAGPDVKIAISSPADADTIILSVKGPARDAAAAKAALLAALDLPALRAFDELGWKNESGTYQITGLLHFGP